MIIEVESYRRDQDGILLQGRDCTNADILGMVDAVRAISEQNVIQLFCEKYGFEVIDDMDGLPDAVLALDTRFIYRPTIGEINKAI